MEIKIKTQKIEHGSWHPGDAEALALGILGIYRVRHRSYALMSDGQVVIRAIGEEDNDYPAYIEERNDAKTSPTKPKYFSGRITGLGKHKPVLRFKVKPPFGSNY